MARRSGTTSPRERSTSDLWNSWWRGLNQDRVWLEVVRALEAHVRDIVRADTLALWARLPPRGEWLRIAWELRDRPVLLPHDVEPHASLRTHLVPQRYITADLTGAYRRLLDRARVAGGWLLPLLAPSPGEGERQWVGVLGLGWHGRPPEHPPDLRALSPVVWYLLGQRLEEMYTRAVLDAAALAGPPIRADDWRPLMSALGDWLGGEHWALYRIGDGTPGPERLALVAETGALPRRGSEFLHLLHANPALLSSTALLRAAQQRRLVLVEDLSQSALWAPLHEPGTTEPARSLLAIPLGRHPKSGHGVLVVYWTSVRGWDQFGLSLAPWEALRRIAADWWQDMHTAQDALHDPLTGARNRQGIARAWRETQAQATSGLLGILDLDGFHDVNNRWGHLMGDEVLRVFARILGGQAEARGGWWGRFGGDEFVVALPADTDWERVGTDLQAALDQAAEERAWPQRITICGGATRWRRRLSWETVLARADRQLRRAKDAGRARFLLL